MRLLCDANIGRTIARALTAAGHDVLEGARRFEGVPDTDILAEAVATDRILITCDRDFGELVFGRHVATPPAILYVRFEPEDVADIVPRLLDVLDNWQITDRMTVIVDGGIRQRNFPRKS